jgi:hypothetical protein
MLTVFCKRTVITLSHSSFGTFVYLQYLHAPLFLRTPKQLGAVLVQMAPCDRPMVSLLVACCVGEVLYSSDFSDL